MPSPTFELFRQAAIEKRRLSFMYKDFAREACPHVVGWTSGRERALVFQFAGGSSSGLPPGGEWRCVNLDEVASAIVVEGPWMTTAHSHPQSCVDKVDVQVS